MRDAKAVMFVFLFRWSLTLFLSGCSRSETQPELSMPIRLWPRAVRRHRRAAAADRMSASRRRRFRDVFTSCCTPAAICC